MMETEILRALADPTRRAVYERLAAGELTVSELRAGMSVSVAIDTHHQNPLPEPVAKALGRGAGPQSSDDE